MKIGDILSLSTRMFKTRPMRTSLTILGVGIGIGAVLFLVSLGYGLQNVILNQITTADALLSLDVSPGSSGLVQLDDENIEKIKNIDGVTEIARLKTSSGQITDGALTSDSIINGVDSAYFRLNGIDVAYGALIESQDTQSMIVSSATTKLFNFENPEDIIDKTVAITLYIPRTNDEGFETVEIRKQTTEFTIVGVIEDDTISYAYTQLDTLDFGVIDSYNTLKVKLATEELSDPVRDQIINQGFLVSSLSEIIDQTKQIFQIVQLVLGLFGLIALIVSAIGMFNTMTIALLERINEIGIMRSVGITKKDIQILFLIESMLMGFLGGISGILLGILAGEMANFGLNLLANNLGGVSLDLFDTPMWFILVILGFSTFIGFLTGVFPSRRAANMDPLEALRYK